MCGWQLGNRPELCEKKKKKKALKILYQTEQTLDKGISKSVKREMAEGEKTKYIYLPGPVLR